MVTKRHGLVVAGLLIIALVLVVPVGATVITVNNGANAIQTAITAAERAPDLGKHPILYPGSYFEHDLTVSKNLTFRAGTANAHCLAGAIINATRSGTG